MGLIALVNIVYWSPMNEMHINVHNISFLKAVHVCINFQKWKTFANKASQGRKHTWHPDN